MCSSRIAASFTPIGKKKKKIAKLSLVLPKFLFDNARIINIHQSEWNFFFKIAFKSTLICSKLNIIFT